MGMYDLVICRYPLPGTPPDFCASLDHQYQSKSLDCVMATFEITEAGELKRVSSSFSQEMDQPEPVSFHGVLQFYDGNTTGYAFGVSFTAAGEDEEWVAYEATFTNGIVQSMVETEREKQPALAQHLLDEIDAKFEKDEPQVTMTEPEIGQSMYLQWRGSGKGYPVTLLAKTQREWAVADEKGKLNTLRPTDLGRLLFHSQEESDRLNVWRGKTEELKRSYAKELLKRRATA